MQEDNRFCALGSGLGGGDGEAPETGREEARCRGRLRGSDEAQARALLSPRASGAKVALSSEPVVTAGVGREYRVPV